MYFILLLIILVHYPKQIIYKKILMRIKYGYLNEGAKFKYNPNMCNKMIYEYMNLALLNKQQKFSTNTVSKKILN